MNYPVWDIPAGGLLIAAIAIVHVFVSHFAVGGGLFLVLVERRARRDNDEALLGYVRQHSRFFILLTLVFGAITGVGIWFTIGLVHPQATSSLINTFVWGWAIEWTFFVTEIAAAMVYYYGWDRLSARVHLAVGWVYFVSAWLSLVVINGILTYMLTPGAWVTTRGFWDGFFNETYWPGMFARTFVAIGLAGLYAMWTAAPLTDAGLKARVVRLSAGWVLAAAVSVPLTLWWFLSAAAGAGVPVGEIFGAAGDGLAAIAGAVFGTTATGYPVAQRAAFWMVLSAIALVAATVLAVNRGARMGRPLAGLMLVLGLVAMGGGEFIREDLRKPYVIGHYLFVSSVRLPAPSAVPAPPADHVRTFGRDRFTIDALNETGVLKASAWLRPAPDSTLAPSHYPHLAAHQGNELFRALCASCHTVDGYLAVRPLVAGKTADALYGMLGRLATPVDAAGAEGAWNTVAPRLKTWRGRRMPPFVGADDERRLLAAHLAMLGGAAPATIAAPADGGAGGGAKAYYETNCGACHGPDGMAPFDPNGRTAAVFHEMLGRLPAINEMMPAFEGTDAERKALAEYLASLPRPQNKGGAQ